MIIFYKSFLRKCIWTYRVNKWSTKSIIVIIYLHEYLVASFVSLFVLSFIHSYGFFLSLSMPYHYYLSLVVIGVASRSNHSYQHPSYPLLLLGLAFIIIFITSLLSSYHFYYFHLSCWSFLLKKDSFTLL